jgi:SAM-dependent methyltransferase
MFFPTCIGIFINPFYFARKYLHLSISQSAHNVSGRLLDVGCGTKPYKSLFKVESYIGLDIDTPETRENKIADDFYDGAIFPYPTNSFDSAICNQVLEHVFNPEQFIREINRVLRPGGRLLLTIPFVWDEHEQPHDYARYSSFGLQALLTKNGFNILSHKKTGADASLIFQIINIYLFKVTKNFPLIIRLIFTSTVVAFFNIIGIISSKVLPPNLDMFLDHVVVAEKKYLI